VSRVYEVCRDVSAAVTRLEALVGSHAAQLEALVGSQEVCRDVSAAVTRLEALVGSHAEQLEALGRNLLNIRMTTVRIEEASEREAKRLSLVHEALRTFVLPLEPKLERIEEKVAGTEAELFTVALQTSQLVNRNAVPLLGCDVAVRTPNGYVVVPGGDIDLLLYLAEGSGHEVGTIKVLEALLGPGDAAVDVGAHVGLMSVPMARSVGPSGSLRAFEPRPQTAACLRRTLLLNGLQERTTVMESAASDRSGRAQLHFGPNTSLSSLIALPGSEAGAEVELVRLDDVIPPDAPVAVLKMDVEGAELAVLAGMPRLIEDNPDIVVVAEFAGDHLQRSGVTAADWMAAFVAAGLDTALQIDEQNGSCRPVTPSQLAAASYSMNLVLGRRGGPRLERLRGTL
jgi:FkbM family methyltransferase